MAAGWSEFEVIPFFNHLSLEVVCNEMKLILCTVAEASISKPLIMFDC